MIKISIKKSIVVTLIYFIVLCVTTGIIFNVNDTVVQAEEVGTYVTDEITSDAPKDLVELQTASEDQLAYWAENLEIFDGRNYNYVTKAKQQNGGTCYAYAAVGATEASILREGIDPSVTKDNLEFDDKYVIWSMLNRNGKEVDPLGNTLDDNFSQGTTQEGGKPEEILSVMNQGYALHQKGEIQNDQYKISKYRLENLIAVDDSIEDIKAAVIKYGTVTFCFNMPSSLKNNHAKAETVGQGGHACIIVGWNDNIPRGNFAYRQSAPVRDGGWIVKNSWGPTWGDGGFFYLSYDSVLGGFYAADFAMTEDYENVYYYDGSGWAWSSGMTFYRDFAAIYQTKKASATKKELLDSVYIGVQEGTDGTIEIYTGLHPQAGDVWSSVNDPTNGELRLTQSVHFNIKGEYTVKLNTPIELGVGEWFSIVVHLNNGGVLTSKDYNSINDMTYHLRNDVWRNCGYYSASLYADKGSNDVARIRANTRTEERYTELDKDMSNALILISERFSYYRYGSQFRPDVEVYFGDKKLKEETDYQLQYKNNTVPNMTDSVNNDAKIIVTGIGKYTGKREETIFVAKPYLPPNTPTYQLDVYDDVTRITDIQLPEGWHWASFNVASDMNKELKDGDIVNYIYIEYDGSDYYQKTLYTLKIIKHGDPTSKTNIEDGIISIADYRYIYSGTSITPPVTVTLDGEELNYFTDYKVSYTNNINYGTATITVTGVGKYSGIATKFFEIEAAKIDADSDPEPEPEHRHELTRVDAKAATCTVNGNIEYYTCKGCDNWFKDADGKTEITDHASVETPLIAHGYTDVWNNGAEGHWHICKVCGHSSDKTPHDYENDLNETHHWQECSVCGYQTQKTNHDENGTNGACSVCGYKAAVPEPNPNPDPVDPEPDPDPVDPEPDPDPVDPEPDPDPVDPEPDPDPTPDPGEVESPGAIDKPRGCSAGLGIGLGFGLAGMAIIGIVGAILFVRRKKN